MRARSNSEWCLAGARVRLTHGLAAPRRLDLWTAGPTTAYLSTSPFSSVVATPHVMRANEAVHVTAARLRFLLNVKGHGVGGGP
jgi:hypothetical protein